MSQVKILLLNLCIDFLNTELIVLLSVVANQSISDDEKSTTPIQPVEDTSVYFTPSQQNTSHQTPDV